LRRAVNRVLVAQLDVESCGGDGLILVDLEAVVERL